MKKRRSVIAMFLVLAIFTLGIGYAQLTDTLTITGSAGVDSDNSQEVFNGDIYFSNAVANVERCTASIDGTDNDKATMTVKENILKEVGDEVIATFTIKSESDLDVVIPVPTISNSNEAYFDVYTTWDTEKTLAAGKTVDIVVTVKLIKTAVADQSTTFTITLNPQTPTSGS